MIVVENDWQMLAALSSSAAGSGFQS